jgi:hypothetical protein
VRKIKALTVKMATQITPKNKGRRNVIFFVYYMQEINNKIFFLMRHVLLMSYLLLQ